MCFVRNSFGEIVEFVCTLYSEEVFFVFGFGSIVICFEWFSSSECYLDFSISFNCSTASLSEYMYTYVSSQCCNESGEMCLSDVRTDRFEKWLVFDALFSIQTDFMCYVIDDFSLVHWKRNNYNVFFVAAWKVYVNRIVQCANNTILISTKMTRNNKTLKWNRSKGWNIEEEKIIKKQKHNKFFS